MNKPRKFTAKQKKFIHEYLIDLNATQSAIRAGYSKKTAKEAGAHLLSNALVMAEINKLIEERNARTLATADNIVEELRRIGFADMKDYMSWTPIVEEEEIKPDGTRIIRRTGGLQLKPSSEVDGTLIKKVKQTATGAIEFELYDKEKAIELLGRHRGMWIDIKADIPNSKLKKSIQIQFVDPKAKNDS